MKRTLFSLALMAIAGLSSVKADEGMWIPSLIGKNYTQMQKAGLKLSADDVYNINRSSLKDAIVSLGFCTGELISPEGLFLTNHHCAYGSIQANSSLEHDYLKDGFWAKAKDQELPASGVTASILQEIVDVTGQVKDQLKGLTPEARMAKIKELEGKLGESFVKMGLVAQLKEMFYGNQWFLYVYVKYTDVRLVGAPPESVGKFGGDTDNWMWPRHTGDFSLMRIYTGKDGKPAPYSKDNVPLQAKRYLAISLKGTNPGDFNMIMGFPGRTNRYATSYELQNATDIVNPTLIEVFGTKLETMKADMDASRAVRIKLAAKYASMANSWKYYIGQNKGLKRLKIVEEKAKREAEFMKWVNQDNGRKSKYGTILASVDSSYKAYRPNYPVQLNYSLTSTELLGWAGQISPLIDLLKKGQTDTSAAVKAQVAKIKPQVEKFYADLSVSTDQKVFAKMLYLMGKNLPESQWPTALKEAAAGQKEEALMASCKKLAEKIYGTSILTDEKTFMKFLDKPSIESIQNDGILVYATQLQADQKKNINQEVAASFGFFNSRAKEKLIAGMMEMNPNAIMAPDANSSLRLTYGNVKAYEPADAVQYSHFTTSDGIIEKEDPTNDEFIVPAKLIELLKAKQFGRYADKDGKLHVAFINTDDITGGNSGSPVINGNGELVGCAFDGNWEAMTGDLVFDAKYKRTIAVDIRYVLFIIEKYAQADNIIKELKLVSGNEPAAKK